MSLKDPLLITKLHLPSLPCHLVSHPHLIAQLNEALQRKLTLITAPTGYGKTTLLCQWTESLANNNVSAVSVSLDERDNDPVRFWCYVLMTLGQIHSNVSEQALTLLTSPQSPL